jgi:AcrR family transcriptional regulator
LRHQDLCLNIDTGYLREGNEMIKGGGSGDHHRRGERIPSDEVRQRMLDAGRELALESGARLGIEDLRLEEVIQRARVPRSSAYRVWAYKDDYIDDLLCHLAGPGSWLTDRNIFDPETFSLARNTITDNWDLTGTLDGRRAVLCETVRVAAARNYHALSENLYWRLHMALIATVGSTRQGEARNRIAVALEDAQSRSRESIGDLFGYLEQTLGLRMRDTRHTIGHLSMAGGMVVQGLALRNALAQAATGHDPDAAVSDGLLNTPIPGPGLRGEPAGWTLAAFAYLGIMDAFAKLDPDFRPPPSPSPARTA